VLQPTRTKCKLGIVFEQLEEWFSPFIRPAVEGIKAVSNITADNLRRAYSRFLISHKVGNKVWWTTIARAKSLLEVFTIPLNRLKRTESKFGLKEQKALLLKPENEWSFIDIVTSLDEFFAFKKTLSYYTQRTFLKPKYAKLGSEFETWVRSEKTKYSRAKEANIIKYGMEEREENEFWGKETRYLVLTTKNYPRSSQAQNGLLRLGVTLRVTEDSQAVIHHNRKDKKLQRGFFLRQDNVQAYLENMVCRTDKEKDDELDKK
jgi:hypothetical protein